VLPPMRDGRGRPSPLSASPAARKVQAVSPPPSTRTDRTSSSWSRARTVPRSKPSLPTCLVFHPDPRLRKGSSDGSVRFPAREEPGLARLLGEKTPARRRPARPRRERPSGAGGSNDSGRGGVSAADRRPGRSPTRRGSRRTPRGAASTSSRASAPVIHFEARLEAAVFPSNEEAHFRWTKGRPSAAERRKASFRRAAASAAPPTAVLDPVLPQPCHPPPALLGSGSSSDREDAGHSGPRRGRRSSGGHHPGGARPSRLT